MEENKNIEILSLDDLDEITGGFSDAKDVEHYCEKCKAKRLFRLASGGRGYCQTCNSSAFL